MKFLTRLTIYLVFITIILACLSLFSGWIVLSSLLDDKPHLTSFEKASIDDLKRIKKLALEVSRQGNSNETKSLQLSQRDINLGISHFGPSQVKIPQSTFLKVTLDDSIGTVYATIPASLITEPAYNQLKNQTNTLTLLLLNYVRDYAQDQWLNASWQVSIQPNNDKTDWIQPEEITLGSITLIKSISESIAKRIYAEFLKQEKAKLALGTWKNIKKLSINDSLLFVDFIVPNNPNASLASYQSLILSNDEQAQIAHYSKIINSQPKRGPLIKILAILFTEAKQRSNQNLDPIGENRAVLLALSKSYGGDRLLSMLEASPQRLFQNMPKPYTIYRRGDLAQHLILSAGLALIADESLAELIGLDKEMSDLLSGRTISAWDLLADKAGVRLAENATSSAKSARLVQTALSNAKKDRHLLPDFANEFSYTEDRFHSSELDDLNTLVELYMEQHPILRKNL